MDWKEIRQEEKQESDTTVVVYARNTYIRNYKEIIAAQIKKCEQLQDIFWKQTLQVLLMIERRGEG